LPGPRIQGTSYADGISACVSGSPRFVLIGRLIRSSTVFPSCRQQPSVFSTVLSSSCLSVGSRIGGFPSLTPFRAGPLFHLSPSVLVFFSLGRRIVLFSSPSPARPATLLGLQRSPGFLQNDLHALPPGSLGRLLASRPPSLLPRPFFPVGPSQGFSPINRFFRYARLTDMDGSKDFFRPGILPFGSFPPPPVHPPTLYTVFGDCQNDLSKETPFHPDLPCSCFTNHV